MDIDYYDVTLFTCATVMSSLYEACLGALHTVVRNFRWVKFSLSGRYQALKAYYRGHIFVVRPEDVIVVAYSLDFPLVKFFVLGGSP